MANNLSNDGHPVLQEPKGADPRSQEKISQAREARDMGRSIRQGKPKSFRRAVG